MGADGGVPQQRALDDELASIDDAIAALEAQRGVLGDGVVETAVQPLRERRVAALARLAGEQRKLVTVVFSDLVDFTVLSQQLDAEDVRSVVNAYFGCWQEQIEANGGLVEKFIGDAVMAVFGLHQAKEDDPHRAIRAALGMRTALEELNRELLDSRGITLAMRVGIDTGDVVVGQLDERPGQELAVVGETVNRASRLQSAAPTGGVLISSDTHRHVRGSFGFQPMPGLRLKGIDHPVDGYLVLSERPRGFRLDAARGVEGVITRTIGREIELRQLQDSFWDVAEERQWRVVTIVGDAGVGKSRLLSEFDRWLAEIPQTVWWFRGRSAPPSERLPNALMRDVLVTRLEIQESDGPDVVREKWARGFERVFGPGEEARHKAGVIAQWLGFDLGDDDKAGSAGGGHDPQYLRDHAVRYTAEAFQRLAEESPVVVLLEDLHWADDGSLDWMDAADSLLASSRVLVVATARPSLFERRPLWGEGLEYHVRLALQSLSRRSSRQLVGEILQKADQVPPSLTDLVVSTADGNPFYIEELVTWLLDAGVITRDGEHWHVAEERIDSTRVPPTLKGVLQARLDALSPAEHLTLQRAAVIGRVFWADAVDNLSHAPALTSHEPPATDEALDRLRSREVVFQREQSAFEETREFLFKHALLRDVTYDSVLKSHRQTYHGLAARWLEQRTERSRRADQYAGLIADHYDRAGDVTVAARWYLRAARQACSVHALPDADQLLDRALAILPEDDPGLRFDLLLARENVLERLGDREAQQATLALLDEAIAGSDDASRTVQVLLAGTRYAFNESDYSAQAVTARRAVELSKEAGLVETEVDARLWWGKGLAWEGQHDAARDVLEEALAGARATGQQVLVGETLRYLAIVANNCSEFPLAVELLEEARAVHHEDDDPENESVVLVQLASVLYNQGHYEEARRCLEEALPILTGSGYKYRQAVVTSNLGSIEMVQGELGAARRHLVEGLRLSQEVNDKESTAIGFGVLGELLVRVGELEEAETNLRRSLELAAEFDYGFVLSDSKLSLALALAQRGEYAIAIPLTADAVGDARRGGSRLAEARALCGQGSILLTAGRFDEATVPLHAGLALAEELALPSLARDATAALARCALDTECADEARALVERLIGHLGVADVEGCLQPGEVYRRCWRVLTGLGDPRAADVLEAAGTFLDAIASRIDEDDLREGFLHRVPAHAELLEARRAARR